VLKTEWLDDHREPQHPPNPAYPEGLDADLTAGRAPWCETKLSYPAPRCGAWYIECSQCGITALVTTAGRPDDPRSVKLPCKGFQRRSPDANHR